LNAPFVVVSSPSAPIASILLSSICKVFICSVFLSNSLECFGTDNAAISKDL
jgi:hypothetical protein